MSKRSWFVSIEILAFLVALFVAVTVEAAWVDNQDGTVSDTLTGLVWQQGDSQNAAGGYTWQQALAYCESLNLTGKNDWRLPNVRELVSLLDDNRRNPSCDPVFESGSVGYWSSTTQVHQLEYAWTVYCSGGIWSGGVKTSDEEQSIEADIRSVRCVRGGPSGPTDALAIGQTPMSGTPGTVFVRWGKGFTAGSSATVHLKKPDGTEADPGDQQIDASGKFDATCTLPWDTPAGTYTWWVVDESTGQKSKELSFKISVDSSTYFFFSTIENQTEDQEFTLTITAKDSGYNGEVLLTSNVGDVSPARVKMVSGSWQGSLKVLSPGETIYLTAIGGGKSGRSNAFPVAGNGRGSLKGYVRGSNGGLVEGAGVYLGNGTGDSSQSTNSEGFFEFNDIPCGDYRLWAAWDDQKSDPMTVSISQYPPLVTELFLASSTQSGQVPILLVPDMMGSSTGAREFYPRLPKEPPDWDSSKWRSSGRTYGLHDPAYEITAWNMGWRDLIEDLTTACGYEMDATLFAVPYDWRMDLDEAVDRYLIKAIDHARERTGAEQVRIVAHGMGGLLVRAYIQSERYGQRGKDIQKFLMVGTPNQGEATPYYLWFGGDPRLADQESGHQSSQFSAMTFESLYESMNHNEQLFPGKRQCKDVNGATSCVYEMDWDNAKGKIEARALAQNHVVSLKQLLPIYAFLEDHNGNAPNEAIDDNAFLYNLLNTFTLKDITAKILVGTGRKTIETVLVGKPNSMYPHGAPIAYSRKTDSGDGTILVTSGQIGSVPIESSKEEKHAFLIKEYRAEIINFITDTYQPIPKRAIGSRTQTLRRGPLAGESDTTALLTLAVKGSVAPYLIDPYGNTAGIAPDSGALEKLIPDVEVALDGESASINLYDPADGVYTLHLKGTQTRDYRLTLGFLNNGRNELVSLAGFNRATEDIYTFELQQDANQTIMVSYSPIPPGSVQASPLVAGESLRTGLNWDVQGDATGFNIYSRSVDEPFIQLIGNTQANFFDTDHPWAGSQNVPTRIYAVSALSASGTESFLSQFVKNDDRDHDGLSDAFEAAWGSDPAKLDSDGDGLSDAEEYVHGTAPGLEDTDGDGYSDLQEVRGGSDPLDPNSVPIPLDAGFQAVPTTGTAPLSVQFTSSCSGVVGAYGWDFGDGGASSEANPTHTYTTAGSYSVSLTITGPMGSNTETKINYIQVVPPPDLSITQTASPDPVAAGAGLSYSLQVANAGPTTAHGVVLTDTLPASVAFVSAASAQGSCSRVSRKVTCNLGELAGGGSTGVQIVVKPNKAGTITNNAVVTAAELDPNTADNNATTTTKVKIMPLVTIVSTVPKAYEEATAKGYFTISRTGDTSKSLQVFFSVSGTAKEGTDFASLGTSITIPAGSASQILEISPVDDLKFEGSEKVIVSLAGSPSYGIGAYNHTATVTIADNDLPVVKVVAGDATASEPGTNKGRFTVSRTGVTTKALTVDFTIGGTATRDTDYTALPLTITIPAGRTSASTNVVPEDDGLKEESETVILTLSASPRYTIGSPGSATVTILDND